MGYTRLEMEQILIKAVFESELALKIRDVLKLNKNEKKF